MLQVWRMSDMRVKGFGDACNVPAGLEAAVASCMSVLKSVI